MTQLEALRLADMLENNYPLEPEAEEAAAELRRLHEENEQLRQALLQPEQDYERGFVDGMQKQMQSTVEKAVNAMTKREWVGLTDEEKQEIVRQEVHWSGICRAIEDKLKEKNT